MWWPQGPTHLGVDPSTTPQLHGHGDHLLSTPVSLGASGGDTLASALITPVSLGASGVSVDCVQAARHQSSQCAYPRSSPSEPAAWTTPCICYDTGVHCSHSTCPRLHYSASHVRDSPPCKRARTARYSPCCPKVSLISELACFTLHHRGSAKACYTTVPASCRPPTVCYTTALSIDGSFHRGSRTRWKPSCGAAPPY